MKKNSNYFNLLKYHNQLEDLREEDSIWYQIFNSRISEFYKHNAIRINSMTEKLLKLQAKYFEVDENGNAKYNEPVKDSKIITIFNKEKKAPGAPKPIMLPGMKMEDYEKEFKEYMLQKVEIVF